MIRIEVTSYDGEPPAQPLAGEFDEMGGTIGRGPGNTLVLPDPKRYISRTQASIIFRGGSYLIRDVGSASPVIVNGRQLGSGREAPIGDGDILSMGNYTMRVAAERVQSAPTDGARATVQQRASPSRDDPLAAFGAPATSDSPFADLMPPPTQPARHEPPEPIRRRAEVPAPVARAPQAPSPSHAATSPVIPEDFDPFADPIPGVSADPAKPSADLDFGPASREQSLDELFDLPPVQVNDPFQPGSPLAEPGEQSAESLELDPLVAIGGARARKPATHAPQRNDAPEIHGSLRLPRVGPAPRPAAPPMVEPEGRETGPAESAEARDANPAEPASRHVATADTEAASPRPPVRPVLPQVASDQAPTSVAADDETLLREFLAGAGIPDLDIPGGLTPQTMNVLGQLFRVATQGTLDLLLARTTTKRELRSTLTTIVARDNNPLKFSPSVEAAMTHLLAPQGTGFMSPTEALRDAFDDLRAHEFGFMAGMRAAIAGALARFDPTQLEGRLTQKSVLDALLPMNRQAKLWALFTDLYADISREAEDNFHSLFGDAFLKAYHEQIARLDEADRKAVD